MKHLNTEVVIIGGGVAGLSALAGILRNGFKHVILLEKESGIGGIWCTTKYSGLRLHCQSYHYKFIDFYPPTGETHRATREELLVYINEYVKAKNLDEHIRLNTTVQKIHYHKSRLSKKCEVYASDKSLSEEIKITCDIVICALGFTVSGNPHLPHFLGEECFQGKIVHSSLFTQEMLTDIVLNNKRLVVLGAGKSSHEILSLFEEKGIKNIYWLYTKALWALSFEKFFSKKSIPWFLYIFIVQKIRKMFRNFNWFLFLLERPIVWSGVMINPIETQSDVFRSRMAIMTKEQFNYLKTLNKINANIQKITADGLTLSNGKTLNADYLVCATGYERGTNIPRIIIYNQDKIENENYDPRIKPSLFRTMIDPDIPEITLFMSDIIYPIQLFAFSLSAEWIARFYLKKLVRQYSIADISKKIIKTDNTHYRWYTGDEYLSKGSAYGTHSNFPFDFIDIREDLGIEKKLAFLVFFYVGHQEKFEKLSAELNKALVHSRASNTREK